MKRIQAGMRTACLFMLTSLVKYYRDPEHPDQYLGSIFFGCTAAPFPYIRSSDAPARTQLEGSCHPQWRSTPLSSPSQLRRLTKRDSREHFLTLQKKDWFLRPSRDPSFLGLSQTPFGYVGPWESERLRMSEVILEGIQRKCHGLHRCRLKAQHGALQQQSS